MRGTIAFLWIYFISCQALSSWSAHDVSVLLPLPQKDQDRQSMLSYSSGKGLLPFKFYSLLPPVVTDLDEISLYRDSLRVIAIRLDPCFQETGPCQRQIRLVWQPLVKERGVWSTLDGTIHTFYNLSQNQWNKIIKEWPVQKSISEALGVHPIIASQGYEGRVWQKMSRLITTYCGPENISRITIMSVNPLGNFWAFLGVDIQAGETIPLQIPRIQERSQTFLTSLNTVNSTNVVAVMNPAPEGEEEHFEGTGEVLLRGRYQEKGQWRSVEAALPFRFHLTPSYH